jgi:hypothetical protein
VVRLQLIYYQKIKEEQDVIMIYTDILLMFTARDFLLGIGIVWNTSILRGLFSGLRLIFGGGMFCFRSHQFLGPIAALIPKVGGKMSG